MAKPARKARHVNNAQELSARMGRPVLFENKSLPKTFMISEEASAILSRKADEMKCSRSDVLEAAIRYFNRRRSAKP